MTERPASDFDWHSDSRSDVGMVRHLNEDAFLSRPEAALWVVADGMGGHTAGDTASQMIVEALGSLPSTQPLAAFVDAIEDELLDVNDRLRSMAVSQDAHTIGSTVAALVARAGVAVCLWAGDSRVYRFRRGRLEQITQDHALVEELVERGVLSREQATGHPQGNLVTRAVGAAEQLCLDVEIFEVEADDVFILCSDGLDKELTAGEIEEVAGRDNDRPLSDMLVDIALSRGCRDNITVITVKAMQRVDDGSRDTGPGSGSR